MAAKDTSEHEPAGQAGNSHNQLDWPDTWPETPGEYELLVDCMMTPLVRYAFRRLRSLPDAEDVVQDVLLKVFTISAGKRGKPGVVAYLYRMTANACNNQYRHQRMKQRNDDRIRTFAVIEGAGKTEREALAELERVEQLIDGLPRRQAEVIRLRVVDELTFVQIADVLEIKLPTVKARFRYGIEKLRKKFSALEEVE